MSFATMEIDIRIKMALRPIWARLKTIATTLQSIKSRLDVLEAARHSEDQPDHAGSKNLQNNNGPATDMD